MPLVSSSRVDTSAIAFSNFTASLIATPIAAVTPTPIRLNDARTCFDLRLERVVARLISLVNPLISAPTLTTNDASVPDI